MRNRNVAGAILYRSNGDILLQERSADAPRFANKISLFGGGLKPDETPLQGLTRELREELDYDLNSSIDCVPFETISYVIPENDESGLYHVFLVKIDEMQTLKLNEGKRMFWISPTTIDNLDFDPVNKIIIKQYSKSYPRRNG